MPLSLPSTFLVGSQWKKRCLELGSMLPFIWQRIALKREMKARCCFGFLIHHCYFYPSGFTTLYFFTKVCGDQREWEWEFLLCWDVRPPFTGNQHFDLTTWEKWWLFSFPLNVFAWTEVIRWWISILRFYSGWGCWLSTVLFLILQTGWNSVRMRLVWQSMALLCLLIYLEANFLWEQQWRSIMKIPCISWWVSMWQKETLKWN